MPAIPRQLARLGGHKARVWGGGEEAGRELYNSQVTSQAEYQKLGRGPAPPPQQKKKTGPDKQPKSTIHSWYNRSTHPPTTKRATSAPSTSPTRPRFGADKVRDSHCPRSATMTKFQCTHHPPNGRWRKTRYEQQDRGSRNPLGSHHLLRCWTGC
jgi:type IV secretory pathway VirB10-like protein